MLSGFPMGGRKKDTITMGRTIALSKCGTISLFFDKLSCQLSFLSAAVPVPPVHLLMYLIRGKLPILAAVNSVEP